MKILAGIVLYNPDVERLVKNYKNIISQVDEVIFVDNCSCNIELIKAKFDKNQFICNNANLGIAKALNQIFDYAIKNDYDWVITLDQDSLCSKKLIDKYKKCFYLNNIGILHCRVKDRNGCNYEGTEKIAGDYTEIDRCITSASFCSVEAYKKTYGFDESMFIDFVDYDYCYKLQNVGYKIYRINYLGLLHEVGNGCEVKFFSRRKFISNHSPFRQYYIARNKIYMARKYPEKWTIKKRLWHEACSEFWILVYEKEKRKKIINRWKGVRDGLKMSIMH